MIMVVKKGLLEIRESGDGPCHYIPVDDIRSVEEWYPEDGEAGVTRIRLTRGKEYEGYMLTDREYTADGNGDIIVPYLIVYQPLHVVRAALREAHGMNEEGVSEQLGLELLAAT